MVSVPLKITAWMEALHQLPRGWAVIALLAMLPIWAVGARSIRFQIWALVALGGAWFGRILAFRMHVTPVYAMIPGALLGLAAVVNKRHTKILVWPLIGALWGCAAGTLVNEALQAAPFSVGFVLGAILGVGFLAFARQFCLTLVTAAASSLGLIAVSGAVVRGQGLLGPGGYGSDSLVFAVVAVLLMMGSVVVQARFDGDEW